MKKGMTIREKVMLCILGVLIIIAAYCYMLYMPIKAEIQQYKDDYLVADDALIIAEAKALQMAKMKSEIDAIKAGDTEAIRELPKYDNRQNLMTELSLILSKTNNYNIRFGSIEEDGSVIHRQIMLEYTCKDYASAKGILQEIYNGEYPCIIGNMHISKDGSSVSLYLTYFEYGSIK